MCEPRPTVSSRPGIRSPTRRLACGQNSRCPTPTCHARRPESTSTRATHCVGGVQQRAYGASSMSTPSTNRPPNGRDQMNGLWYGAPRSRVEAGTSGNSVALTVHPIVRAVSRGLPWIQESLPASFWLLSSLQSHKGSSETRSPPDSVSCLSMLQPHRGSSETVLVGEEPPSGGWLQPHMGSSEILNLALDCGLGERLQPHQGSSETTSGESALTASTWLQPHRVRLKRGGRTSSGGRTCRFNPTSVRLKPCPIRGHGGFSYALTG